VSAVRNSRSTFQPVQPASLAESVLAQIRRAIINHDLPPKERLLETDLAEQFQVSRATIRQALLQLRYEGLVDVRPRRGAVVTQMSLQAAYDLCVVRGLLEGWAARSACLTLTDDDLGEMRDLCLVMKESLATGNAYGLVEADIAFHRFICSSDPNTQLNEHWQSLNALHGALMSSHLACYNYDPEGVAAMHEHLCDVLAQRDPELAEQSIRLHYLRARGTSTEE
jgi:DNA-binding GntR family transcriptional regulator